MVQKYKYSKLVKVKISARTEFFFYNNNILSYKWDFSSSRKFKIANQNLCVDKKNVKNFDKLSISFRIMVDWNFRKESCPWVLMSCIKFKEHKIMKNINFLISYRQKSSTENL